MTAPPNPGHTARRLRHARTVTLVWLASTVFSSVLMPGIGLLREERPLWIALGGLGIGAFAVAQAGALYGSVTPERSPKSARAWRLAFATTSAASVALAAPVAPGEWATWAWIGASIIGTLPLLLRPLAAAGCALAVVAVGMGVAAALGDPPLRSLVIIAGIGAALALVNWSPVWLWRLVADAHAGREASSALAVTEERLRFARDVHDLLGHRLSIIALKAELVGRLVETDPRAAERESSEIRQLASTALDEIRRTVADSRRIEVGRELDALGRVLDASGVRCTVDVRTEVSAGQSAVLGPIAREAVTNILRHSRASRVTLSLTREDGVVALTVENDGVLAGAADPVSGGLAGIRERLREAGGRLEVRDEGGRFVLRATLGAIA